MAELGYRAIAFDLPGFGSSPMPPWDISIPGYGELLNALREALGIATCTLVGNSMGGFIAAEVAVGEPEWIDRLVLVSSAGISHATMRPGPVMAGARISVATNPLLRRVDFASMKRPGLRQVAFGKVMRHPEQVPRELLVELMTPALGAPGFVPAVAALTGYDLLDRLRRIRVPTLVVWGRDDLVVPAADAAGFVERIPGPSSPSSRTAGTFRWRSTRSGSTGCSPARRLLMPDARAAASKPARSATRRRARGSARDA